MLTAYTIIGGNLMTAADFVKRELEIARQVKAENPNATVKQLQTLVGMKINQERIKVLQAEGLSISEIAKEMGLHETTVRREIYRSSKVS